VLAVSGGYATLQDQSGKDLGRTLLGRMLEPGDVVSLGAREVEVDSVLSRDDYLAGRPFLRVSSATAAAKEGAFVPALPAGGGRAFKTPLLSTTVLSKGGAKVPTPRHDPMGENALVMLRPSVRAVPTYVSGALTSDCA
jgi:DNA repair and recombination protein RAD54B